MIHRYIWQGNLTKLPQETCDVVIIGTGLAGIYTALHLDPALRVILINKFGLDESNSMFAQGGIAAAVAAGDSPTLHYEDSWIAGAGLNDPIALQVLVSEGPENIRQLQQWGVPFDLDPTGKLVVSREGAHHRDRIVHCHGDATGFYVTSCLAGRLQQLPGCRIENRTMLVDFLTDGQDRVGGILVMSSDVPDQFRIIRARQIILATGGIGSLYPRTTNAAAATGDGLAAAIRCGAEVRDLEFIQFHPTALPEPDASGRCFLISEAVRGEGGILRNQRGKAFMASEHPQADLAPRDIVARAIYRQMLQDSTEHVWLDITHRSRSFLTGRFPMIYETCARRGIDMATQWIPVAPVQHYFMGGVRTDTNGQTSRPGLWSCGEAACTGIYGANRLASNSLLECLVFGRRIAQAINAGQTGEPGPHNWLSADFQPEGKPESREIPADRLQTIRHLVRQLMNRHCGIMRSESGLTLASEQLLALGQEISGMTVRDRLAAEICQMVEAAQAIVQAALQRKNSIGAHYRTDDPNR